MEGSVETEQVARFWKRYFEILKTYRVPEKARPWYRRRVEQYIAAYPDQRLHTHTAGMVEQWLIRLGQDANLPSWQFRQAADSLRLLFGGFLDSTWASELPWDDWIESAEILPAA